MSIKNWEHFFKPEVRSSGKVLVSKGKTSVSSPSDTEIVCYIRVSPPFKVTLKSESIESSTVLAECNCPVGRKGQFCKHIWAALVAAEDKFPDFFEEKSELEKSTAAPKAATHKPSAASAAFAERQQIFKEKQSAYRKEQYQKQKQRLKDIKQKKTEAPPRPNYPNEVEEAIQFFEASGIDLREALNKETITAAKKKLARVFHPDVGGSHDEILVLNKQAEVLWRFVNKS